MQDDVMEEQVGTPVDTVDVTIDYAIIEHFSEHLYSSPYKAIEELVVNGYDAMASVAHVFTPERHGRDTLVVWDDGHAMDVEGLKQLWWIAKSPKQAIPDRTVKDRKLIGKFGIGKLASYALGHRITHLVRKDGEFLLVTLDYRQVPELQGQPSQAGRDGESYLRRPVRSLAEVEAERYLKAQFENVPEAFDELFGEDSWTVAVVGALKEEALPLHENRLRYLLGNGLPARPDFRVYVDGSQATRSRVDKKPTVTWEVTDKQVQEQLSSDWDTAVKDGEVAGRLEFDKASRKVRLPTIGDVKAEVRIFQSSLLKEKASEIGRTHGIFVMVRDRLLNPDDYKHLIQEPSYGTFYRVQIVIQADGADKILLADRERLSATHPATAELRVVERAAYRAARRRVNQDEQQALLDERTSTLLPVTSREHWYEPMSAVAEQSGQAQIPAAGTDEDLIDRRPLGEDSPLALLMDDKIVVNTAHPLVAAMEKRLGGGKNAAELRRAIDVFAVSELLLPGQLASAGIDVETAAVLRDLRNVWFRMVGQRYDQNPNELRQRVRATSYEGDKVFEDALTDLFEDMGFSASRHGGAGKDDVLAVAPTGVGHHSFTLEAKGSRDLVGNRSAHVGGAASHRDDAGAEHAIIVARQFTGVDRSEFAAVLRECRSVGGVSIATVEAVCRLHELLNDYHYPLGVVLDVLRDVESPDEKMDRIERLDGPPPNLDYHAILVAVWEQQQGISEGEGVAIRTVRQMEDDWKAEWTNDDFERLLMSLQALSGNLLRVDSHERTVHIVQDPDHVTEAIRAAVAGQGYDHRPR